MRWAGLVLLTAVLQVVLGYAAKGIPALDALHGINALVLLLMAGMAARRAKLDRATPRPAPAAETSAA